ncbi:MAG: hypothetical protein E7674_08485 [Ruminococcaceae bacterium]|nr:hypothetical protein [Oscillospiraceae bacterium]
MIRLYDISLPQGRDLPSYIQNKYGNVSFSIYRRSIDARRGRPLRTVYTVDIMTERQDELLRRLKGEKYELLSEEGYVCPQKSGFSCRPVVVGFGPAGMFAALLLAKAGARPVVLERGKAVDERVKSVELFWNTGILDPESNVQFGEGGAGSFSDGKLNTLVKDKNYRGRFVLSTFVSHGAPEDIMYDAKPHIGTDLLRGCVKGIRQEIIALGGEVIFGARMTDILVSDNRVSSVKYVKNGEENILKTDALFLGIGHSARDTFKMLAEKHIDMEAKPFSVGVRIEHPREMINDSQYREHAPFLPAASYKLSHHTGAGRGVYTFCMCPGGYVVNASSEEKRLVTNGMSYRARDGVNSNSAVLVGLTPADYGNSLFDGMYFQQTLEEKAFLMGGGDFKAPCSTVTTFLGRGKDTCAVSPTFSNGVRETDIAKVFPEYITESLKEGITAFGKKIQGFDTCGVITAVESRSTCPVRIVRDENGVASIGGLYPIGEGAGYAGGIMSAAMDGMKAVENYCKYV